MRFAFASSASPRSQRRVSSIVLAATSGNERPSSFTALDSGRSRCPPHEEHSASDRYCMYQRRIPSLLVWRKRRYSSLSTPSKARSNSILPVENRTECVMRLPPEPYSRRARCFFGSSCQGREKSILYVRARLWISEPVQLSDLPITLAYGAIAPSFTLLLGSGTTSCGSISGLVPRPLQSGHMPSGELKEKLCGDSSGKPRSQTWQWSCSE